jgi:hypothetical protein
MKNEDSDDEHEDSSSYEEDAEEVTQRAAKWLGRILEREESVKEKAKKITAERKDIKEERKKLAYMLVEADVGGFDFDGVHYSVTHSLAAQKVKKGATERAAKRMRVSEADDDE